MLELEYFRHRRVTRVSSNTKSEYYGVHPPGSVLDYGPTKSLYMTLWYLGNTNKYREISQLLGLYESSSNNSGERLTF